MGSVALYHSAFTPPITPLAQAATQGLAALQTGQPLTSILETIRALDLTDVPELADCLQKDMSTLDAIREGGHPSDTGALTRLFNRIELVRDAEAIHCEGQPGKLVNTPVKPLENARDLSLLYSPGVAFPCHAIARDLRFAERYTNRGVTVYVISDGSAVLGIGNKGAIGSKPVMEGKAVLYHRFAKLNAVDVTIAQQDPDKFIERVQDLWPNCPFINLEDITAPGCFRIESILTGIMSRTPLPTAVFHDDQHGTATITAAGLENALRVQQKNHEAARTKLKIVFAGAGASAIACANMIMTSLNIERSQIIMCDSKGVIRRSRSDYESLHQTKQAFAQNTDLATLEQALKGADVFIGLSAGNTVTEAMIASMADKPIVFACANPDPEISWDLAHEARKSRGSDLVMATGRSDYPNQVNNVLGFPGIGRGSIDVGARMVTPTMKNATAKALARLARQDVPAALAAMYGGQGKVFGPLSLIPKPFDPRVVPWVASGVADAAVRDGVNTRAYNAVTYRDFLNEVFGDHLPG